MATPVAQPRTLGRPPAADVVWLAVAVLFISSSGPIIAAIVAPAMAIAFWRTLLGSAATAPWVLLRHRSEVRRLTRREWKLIAFAGLLLGAHFATWIPSLRFTTVASSTALVATQPVWAALIARWRGVEVPRRAWIGIGVALVGVVILTGVDLSVDPRHLIGDALALAGAILAAAYVTVSERARASTHSSRSRHWTVHHLRWVRTGSGGQERVRRLTKKTSVSAVKRTRGPPVGPRRIPGNAPPRGPR